MEATEAALANQAGQGRTGTGPLGEILELSRSLQGLPGWDSDPDLRGGGAVEIVLPQIVRYVLDVVVPRGDFQLLTLVIFAGFGIYLLHALFRYLEKRLVVTFSMNLITEIRCDLFAHQLKLPLSYFERVTPGKLISKLTYSIFMVKLLVETFAYICIREFVLISMILVAAFFIDWRLTLIFMGLVPFFVLYVRRLNVYMKKVAILLQTKNDQILRILDRAYNSVKLFKIFGEGPGEVKKLETVMNEDKRFRIQRTLVYASNAIIISFITSSIILAALWYGGRQMIMGGLSYGEMMAYVIYLGMLFRPVSEFVRASAYLQAGKVGINAIFSVFTTSSPIPEPRHPLRPKQQDGRIKFRNVWFNYGSSSSGLKNLSFAVEPGQKVLIVGPSGAGKSTLFNLLMRLYEVERGTIMVDGVNICRLRLKDLLAYFSVVTQDQLHIEDTVLNNIMFGAEEGLDEDEMERVVEIARRTEMSRFVTALQKKYGQKVGTGGMGFSRGELQKIAVMRAASKEAPIILLDEPTASLDLYSEKELVRVINETFKGKTMLMVSHRPIPQFRADWIIVLKHGWLEAQGNHHYLIRHSKYYRHLLGRSVVKPGAAA